jgi:hypothetical protein
MFTSLLSKLYHSSPAMGEFYLDTHCSSRKAAGTGDFSASLFLLETLGVRSQKGKADQARKMEDLISKGDGRFIL